MIFIRTDANKVIATGHVMRCMTIACELKKKNKPVRFLISDYESSILLNQEQHDYTVLGTTWNNLCTEKEVQKLKKILTESESKENEFPILLVDSYYVNNEYFRELKDYAKLVMLDDLCQDVYDVDVLINYSIAYSAYYYKEKYQKKNTRLILGTNYVPLREQFSKVKDDRIICDEKKTLQILLMCGGGDPLNILYSFLEQIEKMFETDEYVFHLVAGAYNPYIEKLEQKQMPNLILHTNVADMANLMCQCDIAIVAAGTVLYECCACSLPTIFYVMADNQLPDAKVFPETADLYYAGDIRTDRYGVIKAALDQLKLLKGASAVRKQMAVKMHSIVDGKGSERLANVLMRVLEIGSFYEWREVTEKIGEGYKRNKLAAGEKITLWVDGRTAIAAALCDIEKRFTDVKKICLLPSYTCDTVIIPFVKRGWDIIYYDIKKDLTVDENYFLDLLEKNNPSVLLVHSYYGVDMMRSVHSTINKMRRNNGLIYIEDMTQSIFLTERKLSQADYIVGSIRKWLEVSDGGFCISKESMDNGASKAFVEYLHIKREAQSKKHKYLMGDFEDKNEFLNENRQAEQMLYSVRELYCMSNQSRHCLQRTDWSSIGAVRNENMRVLDEGIASLRICEKVIKFESDSVPLYYPIYVKDRDKVQQYLQQHDVFAPVLWPIPREINAKLSKDVRYIYDHLLAIPCDHRYDKKDMNRIINVLHHLEMNT